MIVLNYEGYIGVGFVGKVIPCDAVSLEMEDYQIIQWYKTPALRGADITEYKDGTITKADD